MTDFLLFMLVFGVLDLLLIGAFLRTESCSCPEKTTPEPTADADAVKGRGEL